MQRFLWTSYLLKVLALLPMLHQYCAGTMHRMIIKKSNIIFQCITTSNGTMHDCNTSPWGSTLYDTRHGGPHIIKEKISVPNICRHLSHLEHLTIFDSEEMQVCQGGLTAHKA
jgi:hypothetical protein